MSTENDELDAFEIELCEILGLDHKTTTREKILNAVKILAEMFYDR